MAARRLGKAAAPVNRQCRRPGNECRDKSTALSGTSRHIVARESTPCSVGPLSTECQRMLSVGEIVIRLGDPLADGREPRLDPGVGRTAPCLPPGRNRPALLGCGARGQPSGVTRTISLGTRMSCKARRSSIRLARFEPDTGMTTSRSTSLPAPAVRRASEPNSTNPSRIEAHDQPLHHFLNCPGPDFPIRIAPPLPSL